MAVATAVVAFPADASAALALGRDLEIVLVALAVEASELVLIVLPNLGQVSKSVAALPAKAAAEPALVVLPKTDDWAEAVAALLAEAVTSAAALPVEALDVVVPVATTAPSSLVVALFWGHLHLSDLAPHVSNVASPPVVQWAY